MMGRDNNGTPKYEVCQKKIKKRKKRNHSRKRQTKLRNKIWHYKPCHPVFNRRFFFKTPHNSHPPQNRPPCPSTCQVSAAECTTCDEEDLVGGCGHVTHLPSHSRGRVCTQPTRKLKLQPLFEKKKKNKPFGTGHLTSSFSEFVRV